MKKAKKATKATKQGKKMAKARKKAVAKDMTKEEFAEQTPKELRGSGIEAAPTERIQIYGDWQNPMWKKGITDGGKGEACKVFVPKRFANRLKNKVVDCERVDENGEIYYKYLP